MTSMGTWRLVLPALKSNMARPGLVSYCLLHHDSSSVDLHRTLHQLFIELLAIIFYVFFTEGKAELTDLVASLLGVMLP